MKKQNEQRKEEKEHKKYGNAENKKYYPKRYKT